MLKKVGHFVGYKCQDGYITGCHSLVSPAGFSGTLCSDSGIKAGVFLILSWAAQEMMALGGSVLVCWGCLNRVSGSGWSTEQTLIYRTFRGCKSKIKVLAGVVFSEISQHPLPLSAQGLSSLCLCFLNSFSYKDTGHIGFSFSLAF